VGDGGEKVPGARGGGREGMDLLIITSGCVAVAAGGELGRGGRGLVALFLVSCVAFDSCPCCLSTILGSVTASVSKLRNILS
jgi:hypothetical protein